MRGIHAIGEALGPQFVCPSCAHRLLVGETPATASAALRRSAASEFGTAINSAHGVQRRRIETSAAQGQPAPSEDDGQRQSPEPNDAAAQQIPSQKRGLFGFQRWQAPKPSQGGPPPEIRRQAQQDTSGRSRPSPVVDVSSRARAGPLPLFEKRRLASLRRADLISLLGEFSSPSGENILELFEEGKPDMVVHAFLGPEKYRKLVYNLPQPAFAEAFRMLNPNFFIEPYKKIHRYFHPSVVSGKGFRSISDAFDDFERMLFQVTRLRRQAGHEIGLAEYTHLLRCASAMGNGNMAEDIWIEIHTSGLQPSTECYNHFMSAKVWDQAYFDKEKFNVRVTEWNLKKRAYSPPNVNYRGYRTGPDGVRAEIISLFNHMVAQGVPPDEDTFINVMIASARDGDMANVKKIMKGIWNVDVDALIKFGEGPELVSVRPFSTSSPLHPTSNLFYAIAHIFGSNNDFPTALQLVDYMSRQYDVYIDRRAWQELLEWSFVLSLRRFHERADQNSAGLIPRATVKDIYQTMTSTPYNTKPNMVMMNIMVKQSFIRNILQETLEFMDTGYNLFIRTLKKRNRLQRTLIRHQLAVAPMPTKEEREVWKRREVEYLEALEREALKQESGIRKGEYEDGDGWLDELDDQVKADINEHNKDNEASTPDTKPVTETTSAQPSAVSPGTSSPNEVEPTTTTTTIATDTPDSETKQQQPPSGEVTSSDLSAAASESPASVSDEAQNQSPQNLQDLQDEQQQQLQKEARETGVQDAASAGTSTSTVTSSVKVSYSYNDSGAIDTLASQAQAQTQPAATATAPATGSAAPTPATTGAGTGTNAQGATVRDRIRDILEQYRASHHLPELVNPVEGFGFDIMFENITSASGDAATADARASGARKHAREQRAAAVAAEVAAGESSDNGTHASPFPSEARVRLNADLPDPSRFDPGTVLDYNYLQSHSRSALTHPETPQPRLLKLYNTKHLTLAKIKALRHMQATLHLTQRELARDVSLLERW
ncbi:hypothetical protein KEM56_001210, partial [Ascosphaera pollenicola]